MPDRSSAFAQPLLQEAATWNIHCSSTARSLVFLSVLIGSGLALIQGFGRHHYAVQEPSIGMINPRLTFPSKRHFSQPYVEGFNRNSQTLRLSDQRAHWPALAMPDQAVSAKFEDAEVSDVSPLPITPPAPGPADTLSAEATQLSDARMLLLKRASGLDRGLIAREDDVRMIDDAAFALETCPGREAVDWANDHWRAKLDGKWRLVYTSAFATGNLGGERPGLPSNGPLRLGKVLQTIQTSSGRLDNIIAPAYLNSPWPEGFLRQVLPAPEATVELGHALELIGKDQVRITSDSAKVEPALGPVQLPPLAGQTPKLPFADEVRALLPQQVKDALDRQGSFRVAYVDDELYVTRGDRNELRIFVRDL